MPGQMLTYRWFAKEYGWTPAQVDDLPLELMDWFSIIEEASARAASLKQNQGKGGGR